MQLTLTLSKYYETRRAQLKMWKKKNDDQYSMEQHSTAQHITAQHITSHHSTAQHNTTKHSKHSTACCAHNFWFRTHHIKLQHTSLHLYTEHIAGLEFTVTPTITVQLLELQLFLQNPLPAPHRRHLNANKYQHLPPTMAHYRQIYRHLNYLYYKTNLPLPALYRQPMPIYH